MTIIDIIETRKLSEKYDPNLLFGIAEDFGEFTITDAFEKESEDMIKDALCYYIDYFKYDIKLKNFVKSVNWLK